MFYMMVGIVAWFCSGPASDNQLLSRVLDNKHQIAAYNWLAPEVLAGLRPTVKSDIYSFCAVVWEMLYGKRSSTNNVLVG